MTLYPEPFSLAKAVTEVLAVVSPMAQKKNISIREDLAPAIDRVTLDPKKFKQVLYNLLSNAVRFTEGNGLAEVSATPLDSGCFRLAVRDTGIGIAAEDMAKLFREFQQLEAGNSRRHDGTGLGLALTRRIVALQGGSVGVDSEPGKGSTFTVVLPRSMETKRA